MEDQAAAVGRYLDGLSLGGTVSLPKLYAATGGKFAFDAETLGDAVELVEKVIGDLEKDLE
jgi:oligoendopeptidase F